MAGELTASIAHEINQPLGAILLNAETLDAMLASQTLDVAELRNIVSEIRRDDQRAGQIIKHIRSLVKKTSFELKTFDLNEIVSETLDFVSSLAVAKTVTLRATLADSPLPIKGDRVQLQQVLLNLIINAMDATSYMPPESRLITVRNARSGDRAEFSTTDSGTGIPSSNLSAIFEPFFSTKPSGMGMGLSIARTILENHGGKITAENQMSTGAKLTVKLPLRGQDESQCNQSADIA
jgi:signal transduction histidine kinase